MPTILTSVLLAAAIPALLCGATAEEEQVVAVVQKVFDGIAAHDGALILSTMLPDARLTSVRDDGTPASISATEMSSRISSAKGALLERFTAAPRVLIRGRIAQLWGNTSSSAMANSATAESIRLPS